MRRVRVIILGGTVERGTRLRFGSGFLGGLFRGGLGFRLHNSVVECAAPPAAMRITQVCATHRLVTVAQGPPTLGVRLGFLEKEANLLGERSATLESLATYGWFQTSVNGGKVVAAAVGPEFFEVLRVRPVIGEWKPGENSFL